MNYENGTTILSRGPTVSDRVHRRDRESIPSSQLPSTLQAGGGNAKNKKKTNKKPNILNISFLWGSELNCELSRSKQGSSIDLCTPKTHHCSVLLGLSQSCFLHPHSFLDPTASRQWERNLKWSQPGVGGWCLCVAVCMCVAVYVHNSVSLVYLRYLILRWWSTSPSCLLSRKRI